MKLIRPATVTEANLTSNIAETEYPAYNVSTVYAVGARVISARRVYESVVSGNVGNALTDETKWLDVGPTNRWAMFDTVNGTVTTAASLDVSVAISGSRADGLALFNLTGTSVRVSITTAASGTVFDQTYGLVSATGIVSWYDYFFDPITYRTDLVLTGLPLDVGPTVRVRLTSSAGSVSCGTMVLGQVTDLGGTLYGARAGITDFSKKQADEFGNYQVVPRSFAKRLVAKLVINNDQLDATYNTLAAIRTTPCVWIGADDFAATASLGFWKDYAVEISYPTKSFVSLEIEGLT